MSDYKTVLIAGVGTAPAVLTNTVWALAHEKVPVIPDEVVAITTETGRACINEQLIQSGGWDRLTDALSPKDLHSRDRLAFGSSDSIRVIGDGKKDFDDIATPQENAVAADFILKVLRQYTEDPGTRVIVSIAGGRKSMSALMMSCMSLLGREHDRVCHVLVNEPYELRMEPPFLFPEVGVKHKLGDKLYPSEKAHPELSDIPFVRVRGWYAKEFKSVPPSYMQLVNKVQGIAPAAANYPSVIMDGKRGVMKVGPDIIELSASEFALVYILLKRLKSETYPASWYDVEEDCQELRDAKVPTSVNWFHTFLERDEPDGEEFKKWASSARKKMRDTLGQPEVAELLLPPMKGKKGTYPPNRITIKDVG